MALNLMGKGFILELLNRWADKNGKQVRQGLISTREIVRGVHTSALKGVRVFWRKDRSRSDVEPMLYKIISVLWQSSGIHCWFHRHIIKVSIQFGGRVVNRPFKNNMKWRWLCHAVSCQQEFQCTVLQKSVVCTLVKWLVHSLKN